MTNELDKTTKLIEYLVKEHTTWDLLSIISGTGPSQTLNIANQDGDDIKITIEHTPKIEMDGPSQILVDLREILQDTYTSNTVSTPQLANGYANNQFRIKDKTVTLDMSIIPDGINV